MEKDTSHLGALQVRLSHERNRLNAAKTEGERELRQVWVAQIEKEIAGEKAFLGMVDESPTTEMSADDLLAELLA